jgi:hypothetical protein
MMRKLNKIAILLILIIGTFSCELPDNVDPKHPEEASPQALFTNAQRQLGDYVSTMDYNYNISRFFVQYWTEVTYLTEVRFDFSDRSIPDNFWNAMYRDVLMDFKEAEKMVNQTDFAEPEFPKRDNMLAIIDIHQVYSYHLLVDAFGNVPYTEALDPNNATPKYDDAETIYKDLISRLTEDINQLDPLAGSFDDYDLFYGGDAAMWKKFAASLKFRLAMRLADSDPDYSQTAANEALSTGVFDSQDQSAVFEFTKLAPHVHSIYEWFTLDGRKDVVPTNTLYAPMDSLNDPRKNDFFSKVDTTGDGVGDYYNPQPYGIQVETYSAVSHFTDQFYEPDFEHVFMDYVEMEFLKAEAAERGGYDVSGSAEEHYNNAITASIERWGGTEDEAEDYLAQEDVAYSSAEGTWKEKIGLQKWIALYNRGNEAWASWRILDYPNFEVAPGSQYPEVPVRMPYPFDEPRLNKESYNAAVDAMGGEDSPLVNLFWDVE